MKQGLLAGLMAMIFLAGCGAGLDAPAPMTDEQARQNFERMSPEDQIDWLNRSPLPPDERARRIADIRQRAGLPAEGAPAQGGPAPTGN